MLYLIETPLVVVTQAEGASYRRPWTPRVFDRTHGWAQASGDGRATNPGKVLLWARGEEAELALFLSNPAVVMHQMLDAGAETDRLFAALRAGDIKSPLAEFRSVMRPARDLEAVKRQERGRARIKALVLQVGLWAAALLLARLLGLEIPYLLGALSALHDDNFTGTGSSALGGRTMTGSYPGGTWADDTGGGTLNAGGNQGQLTDIGVAYDSAMDAVDEQRVTCDADGGAGGGPASRRTGSGDYYFARRGAAGTDDFKLFEVTAGTATQIGSSSSQTFGGSEVIGIYSIGDDHSGLYNGSVVIGPATDTSRPTGRAGIAQDTNATRNYDNWLVEVAVVVDHAASASVAMALTMTGTALATLYGSSTVAMALTMTGVLAIDHAASATIDGALTMVGAAVVECVASATMAPALTMAGTATAALYASASVDLALTMVAAAEPLDLAASATVGVSLVMAGTAVLELPASGVVSMVLTMAGNAEVSLAGSATVAMSVTMTGNAKVNVRGADELYYRKVILTPEASV